MSVCFIFLNVGIAILNFSIADGVDSNLVVGISNLCAASFILGLEL